MRAYGRLGLLLALVLALAVLAGGKAPTYAWTAPTALNTNAATDSWGDYVPQVATDGAGNWVAVWYSNENVGGTIGLDLDILVARSTDNGATWTGPAALNSNAAGDLGYDYVPQVTTDGGGNWVVVWYSDENLSGSIGTDSDILVARSTDNGASWTDPAALNTSAAADSGGDYRPQVTTDGAGNWVAVWYSYENLGGSIGTDSDILVARSTDNGASWTDPAALNTNAATDSGRDDYARVTSDGAGNWVAVWRSYDDLGGTIGTDRDILVARSTDNGASWTDPAALNTNATSDSGADEYPQVTTDGIGNWVAVWESEDSLGGTIGMDSDILVARSMDSGATWTDPAALNTNAVSDSGDDDYPEVSTDGGANWVVVWGSHDSLDGTIGTDPDILVARSLDDGATWTATATLNTNAATDSGDDWNPQVATDGGGNWVTVWYSAEDLGGAIGTDYDILYAVCSPVDADCPGTDDDGDGVADVVDNCPVVYNPDQANSDGDSHGDACDNCPLTDNEDQLDSEGDGEGDACDPDDDNDTVPDGDDADPLDPYVCQDVDSDTCDDCSVVGVADPSDDGTDTDADGLCDAGDPDDDNDTVPDGDDADPLDPYVCQDLDGDTCDDCSVVGVADPSDDGTDTDSDGLCDAGDPDDDNDGWEDVDEAVIGTDPLDDCPDDPGDDAWPPDIDNSTEVNILDVLLYKPVLGGTYDARCDLDASGEVNILDVLMYKLVLRTSCTNP